jgi:hypothetical protein
MEVDEETRYRYDYVRMRIACRDVSRVPKTAEGTLGLYVIDFGFEREVPAGGGERTLKSGIKVGEDAQSPPKRTKVDAAPEGSGQGAKDNTGMFQGTQTQGSGKQVENYWSAPLKLDNRSLELPKFMGDAQKAYKRHKVDSDEEKVHIPDTLDSSDSGSDSFTVKVQKLTGLEDIQSKHTEEGQSSKHIWFVNDTILDMNPKDIMPTTASESKLPDKYVEHTHSDNTDDKIFTKKDGTSVEGDMSLSPKIFIPDDTIINTQESVGVEMAIDDSSLGFMKVTDSKEDTVTCHDLKSRANGEEAPQQQLERRRSDRLKKGTNLHTMEKVDKLAKKRNLEGNLSNENSLSVLPIGEIVNISADMGISVKDDDFATFDLLKTLETTRHYLYFKEIESKQDSQTESVENCLGNDDQLQLEWLQEETSEAEDFIIVESRKKEKCKEKCQDLSYE